MNTEQSMVLLNWDLLEKITTPFVGVCIEVGYSSCRDLNEMKKVMSELSKLERKSSIG